MSRIKLCCRLCPNWQKIRLFFFSFLPLDSELQFRLPHFGLNAGSLFGEAKSEKTKVLSAKQKKVVNNFYLQFCLLCPRNIGFVFASQARRVPAAFACTQSAALHILKHVICG